MNERERIHGFCEAIWEWYATHKRDLPWRDMPIADDDELHVAEFGAIP